MVACTRAHVGVFGAVVALLLATGCGTSGNGADDGRAALQVEQVGEALGTSPDLGCTGTTYKGAPSPAASAARDSEARCRQLCSHTQSLRCGTPESCEAGCRQMLDSDICRSEMLAFFDCGQKQPIDRWECDQGTPSIKDGYCNESQAAFFACIQSSAVTAKGAPN